MKRMEVLEARVAKLEEALGTGEATGKAADMAASPTTKLGKKAELKVELVAFWRNEKGEREFDIPAIEYAAKDWIKDPKNPIAVRMREAILEKRTASWGYKLFASTEYELNLISLTDGSVRIPSSGFLGEGTLREVKMVADMAGYPYDKKIKKEKLTAELIQKYGANDTAVISDYLLTSRGLVYKLQDARNDIMKFAQALQFPRIAEEYVIDKPFEFDDSWTDIELIEAIYDYVKVLRRRYTDDVRKDAERFEALVKETKAKLENEQSHE